MSKLLLWSSEGKRRVGRPCITIKSLLEKDTGLSKAELHAAMNDQDLAIKLRKMFHLLCRRTQVK